MIAALILLGSFVLDTSAPLTTLREIDFAEASNPLIRCGDVFTLDGKIYTLDTHDRLVKVFGADGTLVMEVGFRGQGPGGFVRPTDLSHQQGKLWVFDVGKGTLISYEINGEFLEEMRLKTGFSAQFLNGAIVVQDPFAAKPFTIFDLDGNQRLQFGEGRGSSGLSRITEHLVVMTADLQKNQLFTLSMDGTYMARYDLASGGLIEETELNFNRFALPRQTHFDRDAGVLEMRNGTPLKNAVFIGDRLAVHVIDEQNHRLPLLFWIDPYGTVLHQSMLSPTVSQLIGQKDHLFLFHGDEAKLEQVSLAGGL